MELDNNGIQLACQKGHPLMRHRLEYWVLLLLYHFFSSLPYSLIRFIARCLAGLAFGVFRIRRKVVLINMALAFGPGKTYGERLEIARKSYENFGLTLIEILLMKKEMRASILKNTIIDGLGIIKDAGAGGKGAILVSGHFGNWEKFGFTLSLLGFPVAFVVGRQKNTFVDRLYNDIRRIYGIEIIPRKRALRRIMEIFRRAETKKFIAILSDQDAGPSGLFLPFFTRHAS